MKTRPFEFAPIRYVHDPVLDEALNVGVALFVPETGEFLVEIDESFHRMSQAFPGFDGPSYRRSARELLAAAHELSRSARKALNAEHDLFEGKSGLKTLAAALGAALPDAGLSLRVGRLGAGLTGDPKRELASLFVRFVKSTHIESRTERRSDGELWSEFRRRVQPTAVNWLTPREVHTQEVDLRFEHTFVNGKIHALQPLSFDFQKSEAIAAKAARWVGYGVSLQASDQMSKVYFVLGRPTDSSRNRAYGRAKDLLHKMPLPHELIEEDEAPDFERSLLLARAKYGPTDQRK